MSPCPGCGGSHFYCGTAERCLTAALREEQAQHASWKLLAERTEARLADATAYCSGEFPCEASTAAASLERELHDAEAVLATAQAEAAALRMGIVSVLDGYRDILASAAARDLGALVASHDGRALADAVRELVAALLDQTTAEDCWCDPGDDWEPGEQHTDYCISARDALAAPALAAFKGTT